MPRFLEEHAANADANDATADMLWTMNQAFVKVFTIAGSAAIVSWSVAAWNRGLPRAVSAVGVVIGATAAGLAATGHLRLHVHGMGAVVLGHAIWWAIVGIALLRR